MNNWILQLDRDTWREFTDLSERLVETIGLVEPMLELANQADQTERVRYLQAAWYLSGRGHKSLKLFARRWAELQECADIQHLNPAEAFADLIQAAQDHLAEKNSNMSSSASS